MTLQRDRFLATIEQAILASNIRPFQVEISRLTWFPNHEGTRWFLVLSVESKRSRELDALLDISNAAVETVNQPPLYQDATHQEGKGTRSRRAVSNPQKARGGGKPTVNKRLDVTAAPKLDSHFHMSIGWSLEKPSPEAVSELQSSAIQHLVEDARTVEVGFKDVKVKIGNTVTVIPLSITASQGKGLIGY